MCKGQRPNAWSETFWCGGKPGTGVFTIMLTGLGLKANGKIRDICLVKPLLASNME